MGLAILIVWVIILGIAILLIVSNIKIVPQAHAYVVERLGGYKDCLLYTSDAADE